MRNNASRLLGRTLLSGLYQMLSFPLAIAYFVCVVTGITFGLGASITLIGLPVLVLTFLGMREAARFERWLTALLLNVDLGVERAPGATPRLVELKGGRLSVSLQQLKTIVASMETWKGFVYLALKFPFSIVAFGAIVVLTVSGATLLSAPVTFSLWHFTFDAFGANWVVDDLMSAWLAFLSGIGLLLAAVLAINVFAFVWAEIARFLIGRPSAPAPAQSVVSEA